MKVDFRATFQNKVESTKAYSYLLKSTPFWLYDQANLTVPKTILYVLILSKISHRNNQWKWVIILSTCMIL